MQKTIITLVMFFMAAIAANAQSGSATIVKIKDERNKKKLPAKSGDPAAMAEYYSECAKHKHHDVVVTREISGEENDYRVAYYQKETDTMKRHTFIVGLTESYEKAEYRWDHDTVCVSFFNTESKKSKVYKGFGFGASSSMFMDD